ncbi:hypothetical protein QBC35DRAFT_545641 [Podospora australis]|uniref:Uncharacterized protein n=1 Tax=Podospora australis TaxID=1536484 RepID=A0AAN6WJC6_9PEZI|nr:hypothetical protein QBC35DRAFT_545641 [Podospora australis]
MRAFRATTPAVTGTRSYATRATSKGSSLASLRPYTARQRAAMASSKSSKSRSSSSPAPAPSDEFTSNRSIFSSPGSSHHTSQFPANRHFPRSAASSVDERARSFYSTVIYHGQTPNSDYEFEEDQVFGREVKVNPTQSEANVAADRGDIDPLPMGMHHTILLEEGGAGVYTRPTMSEESVHADLYMEDPLHKGN